MRLSICLLALLLGCNVTAEILHDIVEEKTSATLPCPHSVEGNVTWSRENNGHKTNILTVSGDGDLKHIPDPGKLYSSLADKSLVIRRVTVSDSGRYLCNNEPAVELTVIPSDTKTPTTSTTRPTPKTRQTSASTPSETAAPPPATTVQSTPPLRTTISTDATTAKKKRQNRKHGEKGKKRGNKTSPTTTTTGTYEYTKTPTTSTTRPTPKTRQTSASTPSKTAAPPPATTTVQSTPPLRTIISTAASKDHKSVLPLACGVVFSFLVLVIIIIVIIYFTQRRRKDKKRQGNEETFPVYDEIQDGFLLQPANGGGSSVESTATYCMASFSAGSNQNDHTYSTIPDLPAVQKTNTSLHIESPYSLIGNTITDEKNKGSPQLSDNTYFLLEKPKAPGNNNDQHL